MNFHNLTSSNSKNGIALIIVLGILAVMTLLAVSFVISMRTERLAARNFSDKVKSQLLLDIALSRAMDDIDADMVASNMVYPDNFTNFVFESLAPLSGAEICDDLFSGEAIDYVPLSVRGDAYNVLPEWVDIIEDNQIIGAICIYGI